MRNFVWRAGALVIKLVGNGCTQRSPAMSQVISLLQERREALLAEVLASNKCGSWEGCRPMEGNAPCSWEGCRPMEGNVPCSWEGCRPMEGNVPCSWEGCRPVEGNVPCSWEGCRLVEGNVPPDAHNGLCKPVTAYAQKRLLKAFAICSGNGQRRGYATRQGVLIEYPVVFEDEAVLKRRVMHAPTEFITWKLERCELHDSMGPNAYFCISPQHDGSARDELAMMRDGTHRLAFCGMLTLSHVLVVAHMRHLLAKYTGCDFLGRDLELEGYEATLMKNSGWRGTSFKFDFIKFNGQPRLPKINDVWMRSNSQGWFVKPHPLPTGEYYIKAFVLDLFVMAKDQVFHQDPVENLIMQFKKSILKDLRNRKDAHCIEEMIEFRTGKGVMYYESTEAVLSTKILARSRAEGTLASEYQPLFPLYDFIVHHMVSKHQANLQ